MSHLAFHYFSCSVFYPQNKSQKDALRLYWIIFMASFIEWPKYWELRVLCKSGNGKKKFLRQCWITWSVNFCLMREFQKEYQGHDIWGWLSCIVNAFFAAWFVTLEHAIHSGSSDGCQPVLSTEWLKKSVLFWDWDSCLWVAEFSKDGIVLWMGLLSGLHLTPGQTSVSEVQSSFSFCMALCCWNWWEDACKAVGFRLFF